MASMGTALRRLKIWVVSWRLFYVRRWDRRVSLAVFFSTAWRSASGEVGWAFIFPRTYNLIAVVSSWVSAATFAI